MIRATTAVATLARAGLLAFAAALPAAALAQYGGSSTSSPPPDVPTPRSSSHAQTPAAPSTPAEVWRAAACLAGQNAAPGNALLATVPRSTPEHDQVVAMLRGAPRCTHTTAPVITGVMTMRAAVAEGLYESQFATPVAARSPALGATPLIRPTEGDAAFLAAIGTMSGLVDCATPRQPGQVRAILATDPGTPAESTAVMALTDTYRACVPAGTQLSIDPKLMRFLFAEALYRWSVVQRDGPASPWAAPAATPAAH
jgi:hypothetical protein